MALEICMWWVMVEYSFALAVGNGVLLLAVLEAKLSVWQRSCICFSFWYNSSSLLKGCSISQLLILVALPSSSIGADELTLLI